MEHNSQPIKLQHTLKVKNINVKVIISLVYSIPHYVYNKKLYDDVEAC